MNGIGFVVVGATGDVALRRTFPALFRLFCSGTITDIKVVAICNDCRDLDDDGFRKLLGPHLGAGAQEEFLDAAQFIGGNFEEQEIASMVQDRLRDFKRVIIYFNPPLILYEVEHFQTLSQKLHDQCNCEDGFLRCVVEKPLGRDFTTSRLLTERLQAAFSGESNIFRLDHFLGKEMVQNIVAIRFANRFLEPSWNNNNINAVVISCRETLLVNSGSYFDKHGILREIMIDHLSHIMALIAMETPVNLTDGKSLRDEVAKVLRCVQPAKMENTILGQYDTYQDTDGVKDGSITPTFALCVLYINNPRWYGVPFILKAGKGLYERRTDVRIQFKPPHNNCFPPSRGGGALNELVIRVQPNSDIYMKMMRKVPGLKLTVAPTKLDLLNAGPSTLLDIVSGTTIRGSDMQPTTAMDDDMSGHPNPFKHQRSFSSQTSGFQQFNEFPILNSYSPDSYERLLHDVMSGDLSSFTRADELDALWRIFTPLLRHAEEKQVKPITYRVGTRGPQEAYDLMERVGFHGYKLESELLGVKTKTLFHRLMEQFQITAYQMEQIITNFNTEFEKGLNGDENSSVKMLPSYVTTIPDGDESGAYYALDLGGTNFRVTRFVFEGGRTVRVSDERKFTVPDDKMTGSGEELFDFLAQCVEDLDVPEDANKTKYYGFTFSFPVEQTALDEGTLIRWTKGFTASGVEGSEVVALLEAAFERRGFKGTVNALVNDTVGTLIASSYFHPQTMIGVILGTGTNAAYRERVENIEKLSQEMKEKYAGQEMVINTEWGNFGSGTKMLPVTEVDQVIDRNSRNPGQQQLEKMISGMYLGELARVCLLKLHKAGEIWADEETDVPDQLETPQSFESHYLSDIEFDLSPSLNMVRRVENQYGVMNSSLADRIKLKEICGLIINRAAKLTACAITATIRQIGSERGYGCTVGIDGSVYQHHPSFRQRLTTALGEVAASHCNIVLAKDGSGLGAALISCGALQEQQQQQ